MIIKEIKITSKKMLKLNRTKNNKKANKLQIKSNRITKILYKLIIKIHKNLNNRQLKYRTKQKNRDN